MSIRCGARLDSERTDATGKGYPRRSEKNVPFSLGIRENTRVTVTAREELFYLSRISFGLHCFSRRTLYRRCFLIIRSLL